MVSLGRAVTNWLMDCHEGSAQSNADMPKMGLAEAWRGGEMEPMGKTGTGMGGPGRW